MNLILICGGYPAITIRPEDRPAYIRALQEAQACEGTDSFTTLLYERLDAALDDYLSVLEQAQDAGRQN